MVSTVGDGVASAQVREAVARAVAETIERCTGGRVAASACVGPARLAVAGVADEAGPVAEIELDSLEAFELMVRLEEICGVHGDEMTERLVAVGSFDRLVDLVSGAARPEWARRATSGPDD